MRLGAATVSLSLIACGRLGFEPGRTGDGSDGGGSGREPDALGTGVDGATDRPNRVFVTSMTTTGALGGVDGADAICATAAANAGLPGTFIALLSSLTSDARARLAGSRGWIRTGDDAPVADRADELFAGTIFNAIDRDELGTRVTAPQFAWIGSTTIGGSVENCTEWTSSGSEFTNHGFVGGAMPELVSPYNVYIYSCSAASALNCFEIGYAVEVAPIVATGTRIAFLATSAPHGSGRPALDVQCQAEAATAGLPGTYLAAVASQGTSVASRFSGAAGWARPDGTRVSATGVTMFDGSEPLSFVNQLADGTYVSAGGLVRTGGMPNVNGSSNSTCNSWSSTSGANALAGNKVARAASMWAYVSFSCGGSAYTMCLQQ